VIAVDGTAGSGKSSVSKGVANALGLRYLDTGGMYRAVTLWMLDHHVDTGDPDAIAAMAHLPVIGSSTDPRTPRITLDGRDVSEEIRTPRVTAAVAAVAAVPAVRQAMAVRQRAVAAEARESGTGLIAEGRDIGTVVLPDADVKLFLTADPHVRAARRAAEDDARGHGGPVAATAADLVRRDAADSGRATSPLKKADDAVVIDASHDTLDDVIARALAVIRDRDGTAG
jgi:cytidylate kinase